MPPADWQARFLASLGKYANVSAAARAARISRSYAYDQRTADPALATAWDNALDVACDGLEYEARRRAVQGVKRTKGVYYLGKEIATETVTEYSDTLLIVLLKAHRPEKYRDLTRHELTGKDGGPMEVETHELSDTERAARVAALFDLARTRRAGSAAEAGDLGAVGGAADGGLPECGG